MAAELVRGDKGLLSQMTAGLFVFSVIPGRA
jgi:hypothetical protein